jgi:hypothetical protein
LERFQRRASATTWILLLLIAACRTSAPATPLARPVQPAVVQVDPLPRPAERGLYAPDEALRDALSGGLKHIGTGQWPGIERSRACAFRNQRVVIVNAYCTITETQAFRVDVYSPERGRVRIYAEGRAPLSARMRPDYFTFMVESEPPLAADARTPAISLTMSYQELQRYEQRRYDASLPGCYGGEQRDQPVGGCLGALAASAAQWSARNRAFLDHASNDWYRIVRELRSLAVRYGTEPK